MRVFKLILATLASSSFFLVSCTGAGIAAMKGMTEWTGSDHLAGDPTNPNMPVLAYGPTCPEPYKVLYLHQLPNELPTNRTLTLPVSELSLRFENARRYEFVTTELDGGRQLVEFDFRADDDHGAIARYIVEDDQVTPLYSYIIGPGTYISAWFYGLIAALGLMIVARVTRFIVKRRTA